MTESTEKNSSLVAISVGDKALSSMVERIASFLGTMFGGAADEFGGLLRQQFAYFRYKNLLSIVEKAEELRKSHPDIADKVVHPRLIFKVVEHGAWADDDEVHRMWAGLLASSLSEDGKDESNLIFMSLLERMTTAEVKVLNRLCERIEPIASPHGLVTAKEKVKFTKREISDATGEENIIQLDRHLDHLNALALVDGVFEENESEPDAFAMLEPSGLAINLYVRAAKGSKIPPVDYFRLSATRQGGAPSQ